MFRSLNICNFRRFNELRIDQLSNINLFAGRNNSGKTSLLEAVFLLAGAGNARVAMDPYVLRSWQPGDGAQANWPFWKQFFADLDTRRSIRIEGEHTVHGRLGLGITSGRQPVAEIPLARTDRVAETSINGERSLTFEYSGPSGAEVNSRIIVNDEAARVEQGNITVPFSSIILLPRIKRSIQDDAMRLGQLRQRKQGDLVLRALQTVEPKLQSIEDNSSSGTPMIWGDIGLSELIPLSVMGEGMTQIARMVLAIATTSDGIVLIDEVEIGIHHSALVNMWRVVDEAAKQFRVQIFATTHSFECVTAAHKSLSAERFRLHRLEVSDEESRCITYEPESIDSAVRHDLEVR